MDLLSDPDLSLYNDDRFSMARTMTAMSDAITQPLLSGPMVSLDMVSSPDALHSTHSPKVAMSSPTETPEAMQTHAEKRRRISIACDYCNKRVPLIIHSAELLGKRDVNGVCSMNRKSAVTAANHRVDPVPSSR